jgi:FMN-dependent NADH-azoreductase
VLKQYLDIIVQPKYLFRYTETGPEGLVKGKKMVVITSRGGDYGAEPGKAFDQQEPYLRTVLGFVGLTDPIFIHAQPMDAAGPQVRDQKIAEAQTKARQVAATI